MVKTPQRVRGFILGVLAFLSSAWVQAAAIAEQVTQSRLHMSLDGGETQFGQPVQAALYGVNLPESLRALDLSALQEHFEVRTEDLSTVNDTRWPGQRVQRLQLLLYPRMHGDIELPSLVLGLARSEAQSISVETASRLGAPLTVTHTVSSTTPWERQQILIQVEVLTAEPFASLETVAPRVFGMQSEVLPLTRESLQSGAAATRLRIGWAVFAQAAGTFRLELPPVLYTLGGVVQRRFPLPQQTIRARALPGYIPPTLPVGAVEIDTALQPRGWLRPNHLADWQIRLRGIGVLPSALPPILRQIESNSTVSYLPAQREQRLRVDNAGIRGEVEFHIPFQAHRSGWVKLPELDMQYFDPASGRLARVTHKTPSPFALAIAWRFVLILCGLVLVIALAIKLMRRGRDHFSRVRIRRMAMTRMEQADSAIALWAALRNYGKAETWPENLSLSNWTNRWQSKYIVHAEQRRLLDRLSSACYSGREDEDLPGLRRGLVALLNETRKSRLRPMLAPAGAKDGLPEYFRTME